METSLLATADGPLHVASTWKRLGALFVDGVIGLLVFFLVCRPQATATAGQYFMPWGAYALASAITVAYQIGFLRFTSSSPGKLLLCLYVVNAGSELPGLSWGRAIARSMAGMLTIFFSFMPHSVAFFREDRRHLIDIIAGTQVRQKNPRPKAPKKRPLVGSLFMLYFALTSALNAFKLGSSLHFDREGLYLLAAPPAEPSQTTSGT